VASAGDSCEGAGSSYEGAAGTGAAHWLLAAAAAALDPDAIGSFAFQYFSD
jgi:hypothetical protein